MKKFEFNKCKKDMYLCIEVLNDAPDISPLTGFGGFNKGDKKYAKITKVISVSNKSYIVHFKMFKSSEKNLRLFESFFDKEETDIWNVESDFFNPFGAKYKFYFCSKDELPKNIFQKIFNKIIK